MYDIDELSNYLEQIASEGRTKNKSEYKWFRDNGIFLVKSDNIRDLWIFFLLLVEAQLSQFSSKKIIFCQLKTYNKDRYSTIELLQKKIYLI